MRADNYEAITRQDRLQIDILRTLEEIKELLQPKHEVKVETKVEKKITAPKIKKK